MMSRLSIFIIFLQFYRLSLAWMKLRRQVLMSLSFTIVFLFSNDGLFAEERPILLVVGTRPELIKMIPVYEALKKENLPVMICSTGQHVDLVNEIFSLFKIEPDFAFNIMKAGQDLSYVTEATLHQTTALLKNLNPSLVVVQGDTTSALAAALAAFYCKIPIAHVEAGLRTHHIYSPFPEEGNRQLIARIAHLHFTPTALATEQLKAEGISKHQIYQTGNTVVDALYMMKHKIASHEIIPSLKIREVISQFKRHRKKIFLLTAHRRESFDGGLESVMNAVSSCLEKHPELAIIYPIHPNPVIKQTLEKTQLSSMSNLFLSSPLPYSDLIYILLECDGVLTDSGGIQEEAISLNKPTLVLRNETDRPEGMKSGLSKLVGVNPFLIKEGIADILKESDQLQNPYIVSPYGDGKASERIAQIIKSFLTSDAI